MPTGVYIRSQEHKDKLSNHFTLKAVTIPITANLENCIIAGKAKGLTLIRKFIGG